MNDFELPDFKIPEVKKKVLSMDEYHEFVMFNLRNCFDRKAYEWWKKKSVVNVPFSLKEGKNT